MKKLLITVVLGGFLTIPAHATPLIPASIAAQMASTESDFIQVKKKARPYGWGKGRKVGWRGRSLPPGQAKKLRRY